jgi:hypothetical protein
MTVVSVTPRLSAPPRRSCHEFAPLPSPVLVIQGVQARVVLIVVGVLVVALLGAAAALRVRRAVTSRTSSRRTRHGLAAERAAERLLARSGYRVVERRLAGSYVLQIDGAPQAVKLYADFLVTRGGRELLAEVKTGDATHLGHADTRRQMLEYQLAFGVEALLLVDADAGTISEVAFPLAAPRMPSSGWPYAVVAAVCAALVWLALRRN